jgi:hypothetical protein
LSAVVSSDIDLVARLVRTSPVLVMVSEVMGEVSQ